MVGLSVRWTAVAVLGLAAAGCDGGASAVPVREARAAPVASAPVSEPATPTSEARPRRVDADTPMIDGKPIWSANRRFTAEENARRSFERNGEAFGAKTLEAYVRKAHAFVADPPKGSQFLTRRNGDRLIYDPRGNVFAVATKDGAPRTMFKPDEGAAYWEKVKAQEAAGARRRDDRRSREAG